MAKKGVYKITGNTHPKTGEKTVYTVTEWYPDTPNSDRRDILVTWELFKKNDKGQFVTTHLKKKGVGEFTFGEQAYQSTFRVEGYLHSPEGKEPMAIIVHPQKNDGPTSKEKDILGVRLTYQDGSTITKALSYMDRLHATVKCQNLEGNYITLSLWEDDEKHEGHHKKNQFITKSPPIHVDSKGYARWNFTLLSTYISIANKREDDKKQHEYYILAEYNGTVMASDNMTVNNPEYKIPPPPSKPAHAKKPQPKPDTPKGSTHESSRNNQPDKKGIIKKITLVDKDGKPFKRRPTFGQTIKLIIEAENVVGKKYNLKLWEHDSWGGDDLLYNNTHTFKADRQEILIPLTDEMQTIGEIGIDPNNPNYGEYWTGNWQEIYAEVTLLYISTKSPIINVDIEEKPKVLDNGRSPWKKEKSEVVKASSTCICQEQYKLIWGNKLTCSQRKKVVEVCKNIWGEKMKIEKANELMAIMHLETVATFSPSKKGVSKSGTRFIGLIQFSEATAKTLGTTYDSLGKMTFIEQMDYVEKYLKVNKDKMNTIVDFYLQVIKPNAVGNGGNPNYIVFDESINVPDGDGSKTNSEQRSKNIQNEPWVTKYGYASNPTFMLEKGEKVKRKRWVYSRQIYEERYGEPGGKTYIWEIEKVVKDEHFKPGEKERYIGNCEDKPEEKKKPNGKRAPWMDIAIQIAKEMKGCSEDKEPMYSKAKSYLRYCNNSFEPTDGEDGPWCAAFMNWTIGQVSYSHAKSAASLAPLDAVAGKKYKEIKKPIYGCIVVYKHKTKWKGHTGFLYGMTKSGNYILLGGNQDNTIRFDNYGEYTSSSKKKKLYGFYIPIDYEIKDVDYLTDSDTYATSNEINIKYGIIAEKSTGKTN
ncbi:hypothetical protein [Chryseobacterium sp. ERMR1:04]|uniref:hypothetical protein n=1 Tax=Chryseobacterium sp. ERMR1:04 TaxID=1705393 RepID=UPI0006C87847|nr:hypothetical protein [Chryseobacterium sp. ERMR1:04]KPH12683.1 hypothetical protein AMQ68_13410 [Chryseobacterium sp. ERMR1:04]